MPDYSYNIFNLIRTKNGTEVLRIARKFEREALAITRFKDHLHFNHRLKEHKSLPPSLQFKPPIKTRAGHNIARKAGFAYLRLRIQDCHFQIGKHSKRFSDATTKLQDLLDTDTLKCLHLAVKHKTLWDRKRRQHIHQKKLRRILASPMQGYTQSLKDKWVMNISDRTLSASEHSVLSLGLNFAMTPKTLPTSQMVSSIESGIKHLPDTDKYLIRASVTSILRSWTPPRYSNTTKQQDKALKSLTNDPSIKVLPADKGRTVVVMNSVDYNDKILELLQDKNTYCKITDKRRNPTSSTEKSLNKILLHIKEQISPYNPDKKQLEPKLYFKLRNTDSTPATFYGLPKIHKTNIPLRPITSSVGCPTYQLSKYLAKILSPLQNNNYTVNNSKIFAEKITSYSLDTNEVFVSFDVVSLFTCIPAGLALEITQQRLKSDSTLNERTDISPDNIIRLLEFTLDNNYFVYQDIHYKQIFGCPMGSPVSAILANLVMEHVEEEALSTAPHPPKWWFRYVDDSHSGLHKDHVKEFHSHLNSINPNIQFTVEIENNCCIAFLDTKTTRQDDGSIIVSVYRKPTHTDRYLDFKSHHPLQHKRSVTRTLLDRAQSIPSTPEERTSEIQHVSRALSANGYPATLLKNCKTANNIISYPQQQQQQQSQQQQQQQGLVILPYVQTVSEKISKRLKKFNIKVAHKPIKTLSSIFKKPKDKIAREDTTGVIYKINCRECDACYIGQTARALKTRVKEHAKAIVTLDKNSLLAQHHAQHQHEINLDNVEILNKETQWGKRLFLEAWHSVQEPNSINEHVLIPSVYKNLTNS